mmetsp:Transcript_4737/g.4447  ORF Transcript_4737/g.4447 Transcript_4737/m.4447 type:complete len:466 (-) Transcript_4737:43-1440(-)
MDTITGTGTNKLGFSAGTAITAKLAAENARGTGAESPVSNADIVAQEAPQTPPPTFAATSTAGDVTLTWNAYSATSEYGYSPVTDYIVTYQSTSNALTTITITDQTATSYVIENLTPAGETFTFTILAKNIHGNGVTATTTHALAGTAPATLAKPTLTESGTDIVITWSPTSDENGAEVTSYVVYVKDESQTSQFIDHTTECNTRAATDTTCTIPMATFTNAAKLNYAIGTIIEAKVSAVNAIATSTQSPVSTEVIKAQSAPTVAITGLSATSTVDSITLSWTALSTETAKGYSEITKHVVTMNGTTREVVIADGTSTTFTGLTTGATYQFTVAAANKHGTGTASSTFDYIAAGPPSVVQNLIVTLVGTSDVIIDWQPPSSNGGSSLTSYEVYIYNGSSYQAVTLSTCSEADVFADAKCTLTQTEVRSTYSLTTGDTVQVQVTASNNKGPSDIASATSSALPAQP